MKKFINNLTFAKILNIVTALLIFVAIIITSVSNSVRGYGINYFGLVITFSVIAFLAVALSAIFADKFKKSYIVDIALFISMVFMMVCFALVINSRTELIGTLWITALDSVNPLAVSAMNTGTASFVLYLLSALLILVSSFFNFKKASN